MKTSSGRDEKPVTDPSKCRSCHQDVLWTVWRESGKRMPVDSEPDMRPPPPKGEGGNLILTLSGGSFGTLFVEKWREEHGLARNRYTSHYSTCPDADRWRKEK